MENVKKYDFAYTDQNYLNKLLIVCFAILLLLFILLTSIYDFEKFTSIWITFVSLAIPVGVFFLFKDRIRRNGSIIFNEDGLNFNLAKKQFKINFKEISGFRLEFYYGTTWFIYLKNNARIKLISYFSRNSQEQFETVTDEFRSVVNNYVDPENEQRIRKHKSVLEKNWLVILLVTGFVVVFGSIIYAIAENRPVSAVTVMVAIGLVLMAVGYFKNRQKQKG